MKSSELIVIAGEILKQPSLYCVVWLLVFTLMKSYKEKEQAEQGKMQKRIVKGEKGHQELQ